MNRLKIKQKRNINKLIALVFCILLIFIGGYLFYKNDTKPSTLKQASKTTKKPTTKQDAGFDKSAHSIDTPGSIWWIVGKKRPLPEDYIAPDLVTPKVTINNKKSAAENTLRSEAASALEKLFADAKVAGYDFMLASGYRSSELQAVYYNNLVATSGQAEADKFSAKPGTSEHQTGLSLDVARADRRLYLEQAFGKDPSGKWLADHAHIYGYIVRYPEGKEASTGYNYEPWHIRYVGTELAYELHTKQQTMEEFFGL